jgi:ubiquinone/menaquinone biosynthesis C-methylase UbiE
MAWLNADMARAVVGMLELGGTEEVLEIGFGPGVAVAALVPRLPGGHVCGVDPSPVMLRQASRRNRPAVRAERVQLRLGTAGALPWPDQHFAAVYSVNALQFWHLDADLQEVRRVLIPGGQLALGVHEWAGKARRDAPTRDLAREVPTALERAGFDLGDVKRVRARSGPALYFAAAAPAE